MGDSAEKRQRNCQCERSVQKEGGNAESCTNKRQDPDVQKQCNADNTAKPSVITNPMFMGNNTNENSFLLGSTNRDTDSFFSELIINENQTLVSEKLRENDLVANVK